MVKQIPDYGYTINDMQWSAKYHSCCMCTIKISLLQHPHDSQWLITFLQRDVTPAVTKTGGRTLQPGHDRVSSNTQATVGCQEGFSHVGMQPGEENVRCVDGSWDVSAECVVLHVAGELIGVILLCLPFNTEDRRRHYYHVCGVSNPCVPSILHYPTWPICFKLHVFGWKS